MFCQNCKTELADGAGFCTSCGVQLIEGSANCRYCRSYFNASSMVGLRINMDRETNKMVEKGWKIVTENIVMASNDVDDLNDLFSAMILFEKENFN